MILHQWSFYMNRPQLCDLTPVVIYMNRSQVGRHVKFSKKKCGTARDDKLSTSNFCARAAHPRHLHNEFKNSFQGDGMDNSNKHS